MKNVKASGASPSLGGGLSNRQVTMISIAGIIGAGLFIGSANAIAITGPAILISYAIAGLLVLLVMRMLCEMAVAQPDSGSFSTYAARAIGPWAGFTIGWLYWWFWVLVIPVEAIAGADILHAWFPSVAPWVFAVGIMALLTLTNLCHVRHFGEFEFWLSLVKVLAIIAFIVIGTLAVMGFWPLADVSGTARLFSHGGFMPNGPGAVLGGVLVTIFSFFGAEILSIAAVESQEPARQIRKSTNLIIYRIALFYILSIFLVVCLVDWDDPALPRQGTFQYVLSVLNVPGAKRIMDFVVLIAVSSCMNSALYTASRMFYALARRGDAPALGKRVSRHGTPCIAVLASTLAGFLGCLVNYLFPGKVFGFLLSSTGAVALLVYLFIAVSQLRMRGILERQGQPPQFKMWLFPWLNWLSIGIIASVLGYMACAPSYRYEALMTGVVALIVFLFSLMVCRHRAAESVTQLTPAREMDIEPTRL
ncbi:GABA permease [Sodalis glossinidius str. 'morsitans']|uniref:GABA permease n=1 Tax=Sodalis glossinidius (strain morsitans) TaxID=343509 RepID=Q2NWM6_SODGM|nr:amino acid permease [Sodalis glossinidius]BAE73449.1 gamma-aminobutyrate transport protein [Sodalis glossinidius str. 'morsitans']CRL43801.1 GABA permease [Sodalis glossinidius str. 'morsitans']